MSCGGKENCRHDLGNAPLAVEAGKRAINRGVEMSLDDGLVYEAELEGDLFLTSDLAEGAKALWRNGPEFQKKIRKPPGDSWVFMIGNISTLRNARWEMAGNEVVLYENGKVSPS